jgi:hypothetical protein
MRTVARRHRRGGCGCGDHDHGRPEADNDDNQGARDHHDRHITDDHDDGTDDHDDDPVIDDDIARACTGGTFDDHHDGTTACRQSTQHQCVVTAHRGVAWRRRAVPGQ